MVSEIITLDDNVQVQVEVPENQMQQISGGLKDKISSTFDDISPILCKVINPINSVWKEINKDMDISQVEVELGLGFEAEGNIFITKSTVNANLTVKLIIKGKP